MAASESLYMVSQTSFLEKEDDVDSLPSISTDEIYSDDDDDAQAEWERSLEQVQMLLTMVLVPWMGKYFGRKFAYWSECFPQNAASMNMTCTGHDAKGVPKLTVPFSRLGEIHELGTRRRSHIHQ